MRASHAVGSILAATLIASGFGPSASLAADDCPNAAVRAQQNVERLSDCRAYEMVSPPEKNGYPVLFGLQQGTGMTALSAAGDRAVFTSYGTFADSKTGMPTSYLSQRTGTGWVTNAASPPPGKAAPNVLLGDATVWSNADPQLTFGVATTYDTLDPTDTAPITSDLYQVGPGLEPTLISRGNGGERLAGFEAAEYAAISPDGKRVFFRASAHLVPGDAGRTAGSDLYMRSNGVTSLISHMTDGTLASTCGAILGASSAFGGSRQNAVSQDGSSVVFSTPDPFGFGADPDCSAPPHIYVRRGNGETIDVSASQRSAPDPAGPAEARFEGASSDGSQIVFSSTRMLTDDAQPGGGIYAFDVATRQLRVLVSDSTGVDVLQVSADVGEIYFLSSADHDPGAGTPGVVKLYVYRADSARAEFITEDPTYALGSDVNVHVMAISKAGDFAFGATAPLTGFDNQGHAEVYLYRPRDRQFTCVSCDPAGQRPSASRVLADARLINAPGGFNNDNRSSFSDDGERLIFGTRDRLVADDTNDRSDVYEYVDGRLHLISSGRGDTESYPVEISADGKTIAFAGYASLVPQDTDGGDEDLYVARSNGGFATPAPPPEREPCRADTCQGLASAPAALPVAASLTFAGQGDLPPSGRAQGSRTVKVKAVAGARGRIAVTVPSAGVLRLSGALVKTTRKSVTRRATYTIAVALNAKARKRLAAKRSLKAPIAVTFTPKSGSPVRRQLTLTFTQPSKNNVKGGR